MSLQFFDKNYFDECVRDQNQLLTDVAIRRCIMVEREDPNYPDSKFVPIWKDIQLKADIREVPMSEVAFSGGLLLTGDLQIWIQHDLRGPSAAHDPGDPEQYADIILLYGQEFVVLGVPFVGKGVSPQVYATTGYLRRRKTGGPKVVG